MSKPLVVTIQHSLGKDEAVRRLKGGLAKATTTLPMFSLDEEQWTGDTMTFRMSALGHQANGHVDVAEDTVRIEVHDQTKTSNVLVWISTLGTTDGRSRTAISEITLQAAA